MNFKALLQRAATEIGALVAMGVAALGTLTFVYTAEEIQEGETRGNDETWLLALRSASDASDPIGPRWFELAVADVSSLGGYAVLTILVLASTLYLVASKRGVTALTVVGAAVSGTVLSEGLKLGFARPRPDLVAHLAEVQSGSFPSGHAMLSAIVYLTLGALLARAHNSHAIKIVLMTIAIAMTVLIGASRVYLGVHWPTDVLGGWSLGAAWAGLWWVAAAAIDRRAKRVGA